VAYTAPQDEQDLETGGVGDVYDDGEPAADAMGDEEVYGEYADDMDTTAAAPDYGTLEGGVVFHGTDTDGDEDINITD
jgi:hypothetical protein